MEKEDKFLISLAEDKLRQCETRNIPTCTHFLDLRQQSLLQTHFKGLSGAQYVFFGGYADAERCVLVFLPDYADCSMLGDIVCIRVQTSGALPKSLTHRDYLGALMGIGLKRETIGDILVRENGADILVLADVKKYVLSDFCAAGRARFHAEEIPLSDIALPQTDSVIKRDTVPSLRLDCITATAFSLSRGNACAFIDGGKVFVNGVQILKKDHKLSEGDKLVIRGKGKAILKEIGGLSKKDRIFVEIEKFR